MDETWKSDLERWLAPFLSAFRHKARARMCPVYVAGLIGAGDRKSVQPMAARDGEVGYDQLHHFIASGMWDARTVPIFGTGDYWAFAGANPLSALTDLLRHMALPVLTLVLVSVAGDSRFIRSSMLDALNQDYVKTARAKGLPERSVIFRHALRNALLPVITNVGLEIPFLFSGAIATETIFSWPGMGRQFVEAVGHNDYTVLMGILLITSVIVVFANLLADIMYAVVDPRVKYD